LASPLLELSELRQYFGGVHALDGVSLSIETGQVFGLIGPNGAGKTTLVNVLTGHARGGSGLVRIAGTDVAGKPPHLVASAGVARTFQGVRLYHELSAIANIIAGMHRQRMHDIGRELFAPLGRVRRARTARHAQALGLLELVGLPDEVADRPAATLAYGQQRRVEIARALALQPRLLILDEPTAGMNPLEKREIGRLLSRLSEGGLTILLIEHDMPLVMSVCSRVAVLDFGRKIADGEPQAVARDQKVLDAYLGTETSCGSASEDDTTQAEGATSSTAAAITTGARPATSQTRPGRGLRASDLHVHYGAVHAVRSVSLAVDEGEIVTLIGANGAGKSTLLATLSGVLRPSSGAATFDGLDLTRAKPARIVAHGIAHVPEGRQILGRLTVRENLELGGYTRGGSRRLAADITRLEERFPILAERRSMPAMTLSGGEQQVLAIARALIARPRLLLLDEPSLGLAPILAESVFGLIAELHRSGLTILLVEQNAHRALSLAQRGYVVETGRIAFSGSAVELQANPEVERAYLGSDPRL